MAKATSYTCPHCKEVQEGYNTYAREFYIWERDMTGKILFEYRNSDFLDSEEIHDQCPNCQKDITNLINQLTK